MRKYKQGIFQPIHKEKYRGSLPIVYRSSYELKFCRWCDSNSNVITWGSESIVLPYIRPTDGKLHKYYVDHVLLLKDKNGKMHKYIVEIKPFKQTIPPNTVNRKNKNSLLYEQVNFAINTAKWKAASQWANKHGYKFQIITEKELNKS